MHNKAVLSCLALTALCVFGIQGKIKPYDMGISTDPYQTEPSWAQLFKALLA